MLSFNKTRFQASVPSSSFLPIDTQIEIAFAGRSNAGKSSVINRLTEQKHLARTSKTPGRTRALNFFEIEHPLYLVDLPGYGYAKVSHSEQKQWEHFLRDYFLKRKSLQGVILIMDARHPFTKNDLLFLDLCDIAQHRCHILLNKADKLNQQERSQTLHKVKNQPIMASTNLSIQFFSAASGQGLIELKTLLSSWVSAASLTGNAGGENSPIPD